MTDSKKNLLKSIVGDKITEKKLGNLVCSIEGGWVITKSHNCCEGDNPDANGDQMMQLKMLMYVNAFRLRDDDGELYYSGYAREDMEDEFAPLDDYGLPNAGCTTIEYRNPKTGQYEVL